MRKVASLFTALMLCWAISFAQTRSITGQVRDNKGAPVPFATVTVKGTSTGVSADANGNFKIDVQEGQSLLISSASFAEQEIKVGASNTVNVTLEQQGNLREVVVTALGLRRTRNQLPYSAQTVEGSEVTKTRSSNFMSSMSGKVSGMEIRQTNTLGGSTNVVLRGTKSFVGDNQALFVVDGVPYNNDNTNTADQRTGRGGYDYGNAAADINPDDIETVTVLKGAAASALYGSRGTNGVILITTKKSRRGLGITINSGISVGAIDKKTFVKYQQEYGGGYGPYYEDPSGYFLYRDVDGDGTDDLVVPVSEDASYGGAFDPGKMVFQWDAFDPNSPFYQKAKPWVAASNGPESFFRKPVSSNQSVFIDGSSDKGTFKIGYTRNDDAGYLPNSTVIKNLVNFGATYNVTSKFTVGATVNYSNINGKGRYGTGYDDKNLMTNFRQWFQTNVDLQDQKDAYFRNRENITWNWADPDNLVPIYWDNPYFTRHENFETDRRNRIFGNVNLNYKITDWLNVMGRIGLDNYDELQEERQAVGSIGISSYRRVNRTYSETNYDLLLNADKDLSTDVNFKALLGANIRRQRSQSIDAVTNGGLTLPRIYALSNSANSLQAPREFDGTREVDGIFAGATFSWREMLTLDATIRRDKSSTLPEGNNVYYYPSVSAGFVFSRLMTGTDWLTYGKLRLNYAQVGNDAPLYSVLDVYNILPPFGSEPTTTIPDVKNNPDLKPERTSSAEAGLEMAFMKNRLGFDVSYYNAKTIDQILPLRVSPATGHSAKLLNAGTIKNKGVELSVFGTPVQSRDFSWTINLNWTRNRNQVTELFEGSDNLVLATFQGDVTLNGYTRNDDAGYLPNSTVIKNLVNFGATYNVTSKFTVGATVNYSNINGKGRYGTGYDDKNLMTNFRQWFQTNVDLQDQKDAYFRNRENITWNWADPDNLVPIYWDNPYFTRHENFETDRRNRIFGNVNLNYKITDWLNVMGRIGLDNYDELQEERQAVGSIGISSYRRVNRTYSETNYDLLLNADKDLSTDVNFKALLGANIRRQRSQSIDAVTNGGLTLPRIYALSNSANSLQAPREFDGTREVDGIFAGATFSWREMLTLDATIRRDKSSTLPEGNNVYYYPSVSAGFVFSRLMTGTDWLTYGKLRLNYAQVGNDAPLYSVLDVYNILPPFGSEPTTTIPDVKNNPDLKPERTSSAEAGLEMAFMKNRLGFDVSYYNAKTIDQILPLRVSPATGHSAKLLNAGTIKNKGVELSVFGTPVQSRDFSWTINLNWTRNRNQVTELFEGSDNLVLATFQGDVTLNATLGEPYGTIRGSNFVYTNGERTVDADGYYLFSNTSNEVIGNPNPDWIGGINNTLKYKNLALSFLIDIRQGGDLFSLDRYYGLATGLYPETAGLNDLGNPSRDDLADGGGVIMPGVYEDGKINTSRIANEYGTFGYVNLPSAGFIYDASYVKLREAVLTYSFPQQTVARLKPFKGIDLSLIGRNLWIIHKNLPFADPEESISSGNLQGYQSGAYPTTRTFSFNVKLRF